MRNLSIEEWLIWGGVAALALLGVMLGQPLYRSWKQRRRELDLDGRGFLERSNPLDRAAPFAHAAFRIGALIVPALVGAFLLRLLTNPLPGVLLLLLPVLIAPILIRLRKRRKRFPPLQSSTVTLELETAYVFSVVVFIVGLALLMWVHEVIGATVMLLAPLTFIAVLLRQKRKSPRDEAVESNQESPSF